jgi:hypothetical protein
MQGELKVTVIATGFATEKSGQMDVFDPESEPTPAYTAPTFGSLPSSLEPIGEPASKFDSEDLDIPAFLRNRR